MTYFVARQLSVLSIVSALLLSACHRPVAYVQPTYRHPATRVPVGSAASPAGGSGLDSLQTDRSADVAQGMDSLGTESAVADLTNRPVTNAPTAARVERRMHRITALLAAETPASGWAAVGRQPKPKPGKQLRLGNRIRQSLGLPLRRELNWWQRISWKLKASVIVILVAVVFAILHITLLAIIFGVVGAFLMVSGLRRSFKVRRPWF